MVIDLLGVTVAVAVVVIAVERGVDEELEPGRGADDVGEEGDDTQELWVHFTDTLLLYQKARPIIYFKYFSSS